MKRILRNAVPVLAAVFYGWAGAPPAVCAESGGVSTDVSAGQTPDAAPALPVAERLSRSIKAPERTKRVVRQILDETNATYMTLWTTEEADGRARNWEAFYRDHDAQLDDDALAAECIAEVYPRYFSQAELEQLAQFLESTKTREDVAAFAGTPLGRKYRSVMRRLSDDTLTFLQNRVHQLMESALQGDAGNKNS